MSEYTSGFVRPDEAEAARELAAVVRDQRVILVHDYLVQDGGAERVLSVLARALPTARLAVLVADHATWGAAFHGRRIETTWAQRLLVSPRRFRTLLPVYPLAAMGLRFPDVDLVISSSSAFAKAARAPHGKHLCYCYTPMRFAYDARAYLQGSGTSRIARTVLAPVNASLRAWDLRTSTSDRIDRVLGISHAVQQRIKDRWHREAGLVFPPVDIGRGEPRQTWHPGGELVTCSRLLAYKRIDLAIEACNALNLPLAIIGDGPDRRRLEAMAGPTVRFLGRISDADVTKRLRSATALIFPGEEDFGLAPVEAMSLGTPVAALGRGGTMDTVVDGTTGVLFHEPTAGALVDALDRLRSSSFEPALLRAHAMHFSTAAFLRAMALEIRGLSGSGVVATTGSRP